MTDHGSDERRCANSKIVPVGSWDLDASVYAHMAAEAECHRCPAMDACLKEGPGRRGMYGGLIFDGPRSKPQTVEVYHRSHSLAGFAEPAQKGIEKRCEAPLCAKVFIAVGKNATRQVTCSERCKHRRGKWLTAQRKAS